MSRPSRARRQPAARTSHNTRALWVAALSLATPLMAAGCVPLDPLAFDTSQPEMVAFNSCGELQDFLRSQAYTKALFMQTASLQGIDYNPMGFTNGTTSFGSIDNNTGEPVTSDPVADPGLEFSETNNQEEGVDEADIFKVDGTHAFALHGSRLVIIEAVGQTIPPDPNAPGGDGGGVLQIEDGRVVANVAVPGSPIEMFLIDNRVVVMTRTTHGEFKGTLSEDAPDRPDSTGLVKGIVFDVTDRANPRIEREVAFEGNYLAARRIGNQVYVVAEGQLEGPSFSSPLQTGSDWLIGRQLSLQSASLDSWIPYTYNTAYSVDGTPQTTVSSADCTSTYASKATNGDDSLGIYSFDVSDAASQLKSTTIIGDGAVVYASKESIVVALTNFAQMEYGDQPTTTDSEPSLFDDWGTGTGTGTNGFDFDWGGGTTNSAANTNAPTEEVTWLHRFELGESGDVRYHATGEAPGWILNQFSISEHRGYIRVATVIDNFGPEAESFVHVLKPRAKGTLLQAPAGNQAEFLDLVATVDGIGTGEDLYATRFLGDRGYLVTFRETDPLWIVDLDNPEQPALRGHLEVPGYSTYLHPVGPDHLLAVGESGSRGVKISIFDVSDDDRPRAVQERTYGSSGTTSEALDEHHAFRYIDSLGLMMIPMSGGSMESGMYAWDVNLQSGFTERPFVSHREVASSEGAARVRRAYRIGDYLFTYSAGGVVISDMDTLAEIASVDLEDLL